MGFFDYVVKDKAGVDVSLSEYQGKVVLVVNVASKCGLTGQYEGLEALYKEYKDKGLEIIAFPCNQFLEQEPGTNEEIQEFCKLNYGVTFKVFGKVDVNGENEAPLFTFLKSQAPYKGLDESKELSGIILNVLKEHYPDNVEGDGIKWNFNKFLVSKNGEVFRFEPTTEPAELKAKIEELLA